MGDQLSGRTIRIRFRIGTDVAVGDMGWEIDNISFQGLSSPPFDELVVDDGECVFPVADAGQSKRIYPDTEYTLDGTNSFDPQGESLTYQWQQISGEPVTLGDATDGQPTFVAPASDQDLVFSLVVTNPQDYSSEPDTVVIRVREKYVGPLGPDGFTYEVEVQDRCGCSESASAILIVGVFGLARRRRRAIAS